MFGVVLLLLTGSVSFPVLCDRSRMAWPCETRFAGTRWHQRGWGWLRGLRVGAWRGVCLDLGVAEPEPGSVSCWKQGP